MPAREIAIGLVGAGRIARLVHLPVLAGLDGVRVLGVAEPDGDARIAAGRIAPGARLCSGIDELLAGPALDAVVICAPSGLHAAIALTAFAAGLSVYLEKPIATTLIDGRAILDAQHEAGSVGMTGFMLRFSPAFVKARALIAAGAIGEVVGAVSVFTAPPGHSAVWKQHRESGGGAMLDLLSHHADLARWLLATEVVAATARVRSLRSEDDTAAVRLRTEQGATVQTLVCTAAAETNRFELIGTAGRIVVDPWRMDAPERFGLADAVGRMARLRRLTPRSLLHRPDYHGPFRAALTAFASAVRTGGEVTPDLADGLASLAIVEAATRAGASGVDEAVEAMRS